MPKHKDQFTCGLGRVPSHPVHMAELLCTNHKRKRKRKLKGAAARKVRKGL